MNLPSDSRYQATTPTKYPRREEDPVDRLENLQRPVRGSIWWTAGQLGFLGVILAILVLTPLAMVIANRDYVSRLWLTPTGVRMTISAVALILFGSVLYLGLCLPINLLLPAWNPDRRIGRIAASLLVNASLLILFFGPALFVVAVGPASIQIMENMMEGTEPWDPSNGPFPQTEEDRKRWMMKEIERRQEKERLREEQP